MRDKQTILGADTQVVVIRLLDALNLAKTQGGAAASLAAQFMPAVVTPEVYKSVASEIRSALAAKNVAADVKVLDTTPIGMMPSRQMFVEGALAGVGAAGLVAGFIYLVRRLMGGHK